ncbi:MAG: glucosidase [Planctomycetes bacterium]|nr:glucosidase [Planctomycetota bacterium]
MSTKPTVEARRLAEDSTREQNWKRWGPYLSERQWGTVREDYSPDGSAWHYFPHEHARSRAYRWGEDGLFGLTDRQCRLCFSFALWNGKDPILKERLFGLTGPQGNHGEDVKELYYYVDATPTHSYARALYKYPQREFPYQALIQENGKRAKTEPEYELADTGAFDEGRYFDVQVEYAKRSPEDILVRVTVSNRGPGEAELVLLPTLWFRNHWSWGRASEEHGPKPVLRATGAGELIAEHEELGSYQFFAEAAAGGARPELLFTDNETNVERLWGSPNPTPYVKDAFHDYVIQGRREAVNPARTGTKAAALYRLHLGAGKSAVVNLRLAASDVLPAKPFGRDFDEVFRARVAEADEFYSERIPAALSSAERAVARQAYAGLLWSKQFYHYIVPHWLEGDPSQPAPPDERKSGRNADWSHLYNRDVLSMPDKWEYPWYAAWDLAFHMLPFARLDADFAKHQLELFLREWYMHPNGQIPAYEWALSDVNPPVHAWAAWRVYKKSGKAGARDIGFLKRVFHKLLLNFNWWVNRKDKSGKHIFAGGFLGLDNIGVFDRSAPLPSGGTLDQADGTAWMAFYCGTMLSIALELAKHDRTYEDLASKFFEHYVSIVDAMNTLGGTGLWDEQDGFYYDEMHIGDQTIPLRVRSLVGVIPLLAVEILEKETIDALPGFKKRMQWFIENRADLAKHIGYFECRNCHDHQLLSIPSRARLERVLAYLLDEKEFLSPFGIRSLSRVHEGKPYVLTLEGREYRVDYAPGEGDTALFGGNSNWRGPVWFPINFLLVEALERYAHFYGDSLEVECPTGSGTRMTLHEIARELATRLSRLFLPDASGARPCHGGDARYKDDPHWKELVLFHEYFHAETGRGVGASHQTGWTALVASLLEGLARERELSVGSQAPERSGRASEDALSVRG